MLPLYLPIQVLGVELVSQTVNAGFDVQSSSVKHSSTGTKMKKKRNKTWELYTKSITIGSCYDLMESEKIRLQVLPLDIEYD